MPDQVQAPASPDGAQPSVAVPAIRSAMRSRRKNRNSRSANPGTQEVVARVNAISGRTLLKS
jgi:hypothetical protein